MTRTDALKKLRKVLGPKMTWSENPNGERGPESRDAATAELPEAKRVRDELKARRDERYRAILAADTEYQELVKAHRIAADKVEKLHGQSSRYRICVGVVEAGIFNMVKAHGDNWAEVVAKVVKS